MMLKKKPGSLLTMSLRLKTLKKLGIAHFGVSKTKAHTKKAFIGQELIMILKISFLNVKPALNIAIVTQRRSLQKVGIDIFDFCNEAYLVLVIIDNYSNCIDIVKLKKKTAQKCISYLKRIFANLGIPNIVISDNVSKRLKIFSFRNIK